MIAITIPIDAISRSVVRIHGLIRGILTTYRRVSGLTLWLCYLVLIAGCAPYEPAMWPRREFLKPAAFLAAGRAAWPAQARKPNVLFLLASQLRAPPLEMDDDSNQRTPNLELLARQGARFDRLYASCPVGSPSRAAF